VISAADRREIIVIGFVETDLNRYMAGLEIDVKERLANPPDDIIVPEIGRQFGIHVSEDDFSAVGPIACTPPSVNGQETDLTGVLHDLAEISRMITQASALRDRIKKGKEG
jgi:hypothetical protein